MQQFEDEEYQQELMRQECEEKRQARAKSCPRLFSLGSGHRKQPLWAPKPVPLQPVLPPGVAPPWNLRPDKQFELTQLPNPRKRITVPPLKGDTYLREVQDFTAMCRSRASEVLGPKAYNEAAKGWGLARIPSDSLAGKSREEKTMVPKQLADVTDLAAEDNGDACDAIAEIEEVHECDDNDCVLEDSLGSEPIMAQLWEKWPPTCGSACGSRTPTTRPPSQGDTVFSVPSSCIGSRPGSRPSTRRSSQGTSSRPFALRRLRAERPSSSPIIRNDDVRFQRSLSSPQLDDPSRPSSSPQLTHPHLVRPAPLGQLVC